jgi:hypothetical protein
VELEIYVRKYLKNTFSKSIGGHMEIVKKTILDLAMPKL